MICLFLSSFLTGFSSIVWQIILAREFLSACYGSEVIIGIIFASWLLWIGIGSILGNLLFKVSKKNIILFLSAQLITLALFFLEIILIRDIRNYLNVPTSELIPFSQVFAGIFIIFAPACLLLGIQFPLLIKCFENNTVTPKLSNYQITKLPNYHSPSAFSFQPSAVSNNQQLTTNNLKALTTNAVSIVYVSEILGSFIGGIIFTFILSNISSHLQILMFISLAIIVGNSLLAFFHLRKYVRLLFLFLYLILITGILLLISTNYPAKLDTLLYVKEWKTINPLMKIVDWKNTKYQNLALLKYENQYTMFSNGQPLFSYPNEITSQYKINMILSQQSILHNILLIGSDGGNLIKEILNYDISRLDVVEIDKEILNITNYIANSVPMGYSKRHKNTKAQRHKENYKLQITNYERQPSTINYQHKHIVHFHFIDGKLFLLKTKHKYDTIIINAGEPLNAYQNRFFTKEFFEIVKKNLSHNGVMSIVFLSKEDYLGTEIKQFNASIYHTIKKIFPYTLIIPGDYALMFAAMKPNILSDIPATLVDRFEKRKIKFQYFSKYVFYSYVIKNKIDIVTKELENFPNPFINLDLKPVTYYINFILSSKFTGKDSKNTSPIINFFKFLITLSFPIILLIFLFFSIVSFAILFTINILWFKNKENNNNISKRTTLLFSVASTGFSEIVLEIILLLVFQALYGYVYQFIGLIVASLMLGFAVGSLWGYVREMKMQNKNKDTKAQRYKSTEKLSTVDCRLSIENSNNISTRLNDRQQLTTNNQDNSADSSEQLSNYQITKLPNYLKFYLTIDFIILLQYFLFLLVFPVLPKIPYQTGIIIILIVSFVSGILPGLQFILANQSRKIEAGSIYGIDLLGSFCGAAIGGTLLLPLIGIYQTILVIATIKILSCLLLRITVHT